MSTLRLRLCDPLGTEWRTAAGDVHSLGRELSKQTESLRIGVSVDEKGSPGDGDRGGCGKVLIMNY